VGEKNFWRRKFFISRIQTLVKFFSDLRCQNKMTETENLMPILQQVSTCPPHFPGLRGVRE